ncbi:MAG: 3-dehydroquinate synthase [Bacillota bacterium]
MSEIIRTRGYNIYIGQGLIDEAGQFFAAYGGRQACIVSDTNVAGLYADKLAAALQKVHIKVKTVVIPAGEDSKSVEMLLYLYKEMTDISLARSDLVVALGGGVIGDLAGFAAATYMRGVNFVQVPTSLLAQVDSSIGGKVAIDLPQGKNLVGSFYDPSLVIVDTELLHTLDERQKAAGMAEIIKYASIKDSLLFELLEKGVAAQDLSTLVARSIAIKKSYVEKDPWDKGIRAELNFGHTLAHAIESTLAYKNILHGEAVAIGMAAAASLSEKIALAPPGTSKSIKDVLQAYDLPVTMPRLDNNKLQAAFRLDKKGAGVVVLLQHIGQAVIKQVDESFLHSLVQEVKG